MYCEEKSYYFVDLEDSTSLSWNATYPYVVGPTFYGNVLFGKVASINEPVIVYTPDTSIVDITGTGLRNTIDQHFKVKLIPNPASDLVAIQLLEIAKQNYQVALFDLQGNIINESQINQGSTIAFFDLRTLYTGVYFVKIKNSIEERILKLLIEK